MSTKTYTNPWAGLSSYQDPESADVQLKFCGRDNESFDVAQLIDDNIFVTLYGKSGIGKTSLLNAGVFPRLRQEQYLPVSIRLGMEAFDISFQQCVLTKISQALQGKGTQTTVEVVPMPADEQSTEYLWSYFSRTRFMAADGSTLFPVLVFDQFEEVFRNRRDEAETLLRQIHFMMDENHALSDRMVDGQSYQYDFNFRFVASIREDDLYRLEDSIDNCYLPELKRCRYRLRSLSEQGASDVILIPGEGLFKAEEQKDVVEKIVGKSRNEDGSISTNIISLLCSRIYADFQRSGADYISPVLVDSFLKGNPFEQFYNEATRGFSNREKSYIEDHLVDSTGRRNSVPEGDFLLHIKNGATLLEGKSHILQRTSTSSDGKNYRIELIHDSFCEPLKRQKEKRMQRRKIRFFTMSFIGFLCVLGTLWLYINQIENANKGMTENKIRFLAEKIKSLTDEGDSYAARLLALDVSQQYSTPDIESAIRVACSSNSAILRGHGACVSTVCFSPDDKYILSAAYDNTIRLWDANDGKLIRIYKGHTQSDIESAIFYPDGRKIISCANDSSAIIWDIETGKILKRLQGHNNHVNSVAISHDEKYAFTASYDNTIKVWNAESGMCIATLCGHLDAVEWVSVSPDGTLLLSSSKDKTIKLWDWKMGKCLKTLNGHVDGVRYVDFCPNGYLCVSTSDDKTVRVWDIRTGKCLRVIYGHSDVIYSGGISPDGVYFASGSYDRTIRLWKIDTGECVDILKGHSMYVSSPTFNSTGTRIVSASVDNTIRLWDIKKDIVVNTFNIEENAHGVDFDDTGDNVIITTDSNMQVFDVNSKERKSIIEEKTYMSGYLNVWNIKAPQKTNKIPCYAAWPYYSFSRDRKIVLTVRDEHYFQIWNTKDFSNIRDIHFKDFPKKQVVLNSDGSMIAYGTDDNTIAIMNSENGKIISMITDVFRFRNYVFSNDDKYLITCSYDENDVNKWDIKTAKCVGKWKGHTHRVYDIDVSPDGKYIVSVSHDGTIKFWDYQSAICLVTYNVVQYGKVFFSPKCDKIAMISLDDKKVTILDFPPLQKLIEDTRERFKNRKLTPEERRKYYLE